jgi:hypothetical protein
VFRSVRPLGLAAVAGARPSGVFPACSSGWLPTWLPGHPRIKEPGSAIVEAVRVRPARRREQAFVVELVGRRQGQYVGVAACVAARPMSSVRFSGLRITVQGWPYWSESLLDVRAATEIDGDT